LTTLRVRLFWLAYGVFLTLSFFAIDTHGSVVWSVVVAAVLTFIAGITLAYYELRSQGFW
jgi:hypothetical protein